MHVVDVLEEVGVVRWWREDWEEAELLWGELSEMGDKSD